MGPPIGKESRIVFKEPQANLYVSDIERSLEFYGEVLGGVETFRVPKEGPPSHVELRLGALRLGLATVESLGRDHGIVGGPGPARLEIALFTDDPDGAYTWSVSHGAPSLRAPADFRGYIRHARVADPDGNPVVFTTRLPVTRTADPGERPQYRNHLFNVYTADLDRSLRFYRDLLGFAETFRTPKDGPPEHVEMELDPLNLGVSTLEALREHHGLSGGGGPARGEVVLWVDDVDAAASWVATAGVPSLNSPHNFAGALRGAWFADPDGNPVQLVMRRKVG
jgi:catechol 2,3-dioxygenase-like lactoylglutathione lyase family enzyme